MSGAIFYIQFSRNNVKNDRTLFLIAQSAKRNSPSQQAKGEPMKTIALGKG